MIRSKEVQERIIMMIAAMLHQKINPQARIQDFKVGVSNIVYLYKYERGGGGGGGDHRCRRPNTKGGGGWERSVPVKFQLLQANGKYTQNELTHQ